MSITADKKPVLKPSKDLPEKIQVLPREDKTRQNRTNSSQETLKNRQDLQKELHKRMEPRQSDRHASPNSCYGELHRAILMRRELFSPTEPCS